MCIRDSTYNGAAQTPEWDNFDQENSSVSVTAQTNAGTHTATFTLLNGCLLYTSRCV